MKKNTYAVGRYHTKEGVQLFIGLRDKVESAIREIAIKIQDRDLDRVSMKCYDYNCLDEQQQEVIQLNRKIGSNTYTIVEV